LTYKNLLSCEENNTTPLNLVTNLPKPVISKLNTTSETLRLATHTYIAGFVAKKLNRNLFKDCKNCLLKICSNTLTDDHEIILAREYQKTRHSLKYPTTNFKILVHDIILYISVHLPSECHCPGIRKLLISNIINKYDFSVLHCPDHDESFETEIAECIVKLFINHWCTEINQILSGKRQITQEEQDPIKKLAHVWHSKH